MTAHPVALRFGHLDDVCARDSVIFAAAPTDIATILVRLFSGIVALTPSFLAFRGAGLDDDLLAVPSDNATPTHAVSSGFLRSWIAYKILGLGSRLTHLHRFAVDADPAWQTIFLIRQRFSFSRIALAAFLFAINGCALENSSIQATPARFRNATGSARFFRRIETLTTLGLTLGLGG